MDAGLVMLAIVGSLGAAAAFVWLAVASIRRSLETRLRTTDAELRRLGDSGDWRERGLAEMRRELSTFREVFEQMRVREEERRQREEQGWAVLHRVSSVLTGSHGAGKAGENVVREALAHFPPSMVVTDFRVNGHVVEFGLVLPDGRRLPIDSKWSAERELAALAAAEDAVERERLGRSVEQIVARRAREVAAYLDPAVTAPVAVAAVPDPAYAVLRRAHAEAYRQGVIVVPYSMVLPMALFVLGMASRFSSAEDVQAVLADLAAALDAIESTLENKLARASAMLSNGAEELRGQVGRARRTLALGNVAATARGSETTDVPASRWVEACSP